MMVLRCYYFIIILVMSTHQLASMRDTLRRSLFRCHFTRNYNLSPCVLCSSSHARYRQASANRFIDGKNESCCRLMANTCFRKVPKNRKPRKRSTFQPPSPLAQPADVEIAQSTAKVRSPEEARRGDLLRGSGRASPKL